jgi:exonuclease SbcC
MKIKEFFIKRYGPLQELGYTLSHPFNLIVGKNEDGKTLTIDALVKLLLGKKVKGFDKIDRVEETPEGYVVIVDEERNEIKLPEGGELTDFAGISSSSECRNIFIIRDSDLSITAEGEFYALVTDRLTGLRTEEISAIKKELQQIGRLTRPDSSGVLSDREEFENIKSRVDAARGILEMIDEVQRVVQEERYDGLEEEVVQQRERIERIEYDIERLEDARRREKHEKGCDALGKLENAKKKLNELNVYNEDDGQIWKDSKRNIQVSREAKEALIMKLKKTEKEFKEIDERLGEKKGEFQVLEDRKRKVDEVKTEVHLYEIKQGEWVQREQTKRFWSWLAISSAILLGVSLLGLVFRPSMPSYIGAFLFVGLTLGALIPLYSLVRSRAWLAGALEGIKLSLAKFSLSAETIEDINAEIQRFDEEHRRKSEEIQEITRRKENLQENITETRNKAIPSEESKINEAQKIIATIQKKSHVESREDYDKRLKQKQQYERAIGEQRGILQSLWGTKGESQEHNITFWDHEIKTLEAYADKSKGIKYDENLVAQLQIEKNDATKKLSDLSNRMMTLQKKLEEVERRVNGILQLEADYLHCETSVDLDAISDQLLKFINDKEFTRDAVLKVMEIFEEIEAEEQEKVAELFGSESPITHYFTEITDGLYEAVFFNQGKGQIEVRRKDGVILGAEKLSGGAYDQLYLAIRLALGERILQGATGFFIMDDPFVKADQARLQKQIEVLQRIVKLGWQVLYFSAKAEMRDALKTPIKRGVVGYLEIQGIFQ